MFDLPPLLTYSLGFLLIALSARLIGQFFSRFGLPYITGYLLAGALAGPFVLGLLPAAATDQLRYIDNVSLAIIAFIAGSELYLRELRSRLRGILLNTAGIAVVAMLMIGVALFILQGFIPFTAGFPPVVRAAVALLGATILLALSPASTIAVIQEVRARGPFSRTVLSITVVMDVVIIIFFAMALAFAQALIAGEPLTASFVLLLAVDIVLALLSGYVIGRVIALLLATPLGAPAKIALLLALGFVIFEASTIVPGIIYDVTGLKLKAEPLLMAMVAGFTVTNFTRYRQQFDDLLHEVSPWIYLAFFTLTGLALKLDVLFSTLGIAVILFGVRMLAIIIGTNLGGTIAREPAQLRRYAGLGLITQAGIALGLARETAVTFPELLGGDFATLIIAVIVLNEIFGPLLLKFALRRVGEARIPGGAVPGEPRHLLILGIEPQSMALARQVAARGWRVVVADTDAERVAQLEAEDVDERVIPGIDEETLRPLLPNERAALVAMMDDDDANMRAVRIARDACCVDTVVVRLRDVRQREAFVAAGARVIDPASAMVHLLDQTINAPEAVDLLLQQDPDHTLMQIRVTDRAVDGLPLRDLRLPADVLILEIARDGQAIVPHGFSTLRISDEVTAIGSPASLAEVALKLEA
jgi:Trk K+ transport system NAD-binding subunit/Kef-type K+ transport system membrane component KefB